MSSILSAPFSLYSIPAAWFLAYIPQVIKACDTHIGMNDRDSKFKRPTSLQGMTISKVTTYDNLNPRSNIARISAQDSNVDERLKAKAARAEGAHQNGLESFPLWSIAVLVANYAGLASGSINTTAIVYLGSRVVYNYIYINQSKPWHATSRTLVWSVGAVSALSLLIRSANLVSRT